MIRRLTHLAIPSHLGDPIGLARRVWGQGGTEGRFAMVLAALGTVATPLDMLLRRWEERQYRAAPPPTRPMVFVCGPARSGTTVLGQTLLQALPVSYFTNLSSVFPRSPLSASRLLGVRPRHEVVTTSSHYGRSARFRGPNDALYLWDRWLGGDRTKVLDVLEPAAAERMVRFFGAYERWSGLPLVTKNNSLNAHASLVGDHLPSARFVCLDRDPVFLAQSLLIARKYIHGDEASPYGLHDQGARVSDPVVDVCRQVRFNRDLARRQERALGSERFMVVSYEEFCSDPTPVVQLVADWLGVEPDLNRVPASLKASRSRRIPQETFDRIERELSR